MLIAAMWRDGSFFVEKKFNGLHGKNFSCVTATCDTNSQLEVNKFPYELHFQRQLTAPRRVNSALKFDTLAERSFVTLTFVEWQASPSDLEPYHVNRTPNNVKCVCRCSHTFARFIYVIGWGTRWGSFSQSNVQCYLTQANLWQFIARMFRAKSEYRRRRFASGEV